MKGMDLGPVGTGKIEQNEKIQPKPEKEKEKEEEEDLMNMMALWSPPSIINNAYL